MNECFSHQNTLNISYTRRWWHFVVKFINIRIK